jgi:L-alanine-DL-glutamate epimerase-like enolase superfamily enzyme
MGHQVSVTRRTLGFREPLLTAFGEVHDRELFLFELTGPDGVTGLGEAAPLEPYDGVSADAVEEVLGLYAERLRTASPDSPGALLLDECRAIADLPCALAAVDLALWDRAGKRAGRPVAALLSDRHHGWVHCNAMIGAMDRAGAASEAGRAAAEGFGCVKLKVGTGDDAGRVAAVRAAIGPDTLLRLDANGAWTPDEAVVAIDALSPAGLEFVEEPVHGLEELREVRGRVAVRIAMDESAALHGAFAAGTADAVCLKISRCGGIGGLLAQATLARTTGTEVYVSSSLDGPLGIAAAVHAAAALRIEAPCGLATLGMLDVEIPPDLAVLEGSIRVPSSPGLHG